MSHPVYGLNELREMFLRFFESKGHLRLPSFSLIPQNDKSILLINAGMTPMKPWFKGEEEPPRRRVCTCQKCIRTGDIDNVGHTARHGTFFEMLGNFSFGDYFKHEAIAWSWEFLTSPEWVGLEPDRLYPSVFAGSETTPADDEAFAIWRDEVGIPAERIEAVSFGREKPVAYGHSEEAWAQNRRADIAATDERVADLEHILAEKQSELDEIVSETREQEETLRAKAKALEPKIDERTLTAFKRIRKNARNGLGIVYVQRNACGGCFNRIPPQKQMEIRMHKKVIVCEYCGRIRISVEQVKLYDCFGLIGVPCRCSAEAHMTVQPDTFPIRVNLIPNPDSQEDSDSYSQERPGADLTETFQIREYVSGDSMRQIHWKLSGKFDRLIVRDPALPITRNVLVFWERTGQSGSVKRIDAQAETVVSACRSLSDSGVQFTLGWNDTDSNVCVLHEICGMEDLVGVIPRLLCAAGRKDGVGGASLLVQTRPDALCGHMVYIGEEPCADVLQMQRLGHVTALLCGESPLEGSIPFDVGRYREQLGEIDI